MDSEEGRHYSVPDWLREKWDELEGLSKQLTGGEVNKVSRPKIQSVPEYMAAREEFKKYYSPQIISIGPIHHGSSRLDHGTPYKSLWTAMYLKNTNQTFGVLYERIFIHLVELRKQFARGHYDYIKLDDDHATSWMLLLEGCSVLQLLKKSNNSVNAEQELEISIDKLVRVHQDLLILDNQIPFKVLRLLCNDEDWLEICLKNFLEIHCVRTRMPSIGMSDMGKKNTSAYNAQGAEEHKITLPVDEHQNEDEPVHLLDYLRRAMVLELGLEYLTIIYDRLHIERKSLHLMKCRIGTIQELKAAGISVRKRLIPLPPRLYDEVLRLPEINVDGSTALIFLNLIAYEMCPDFHNKLEISSYVVFLSSLINQPEDVKELRSAGILINKLASDKEVADLFNKMDSVMVPESRWHLSLIDRIRSHSAHKRNKIKILGWMEEAYNTFLRSPWTIIALLAATLGLVLTFIQTWLAIHPKGP